MRKDRSSSFALRAAGLLGCTALAAPAQNTAIVPAVCETLPGNAALALPLRWSHGTMQVFVDPPMLGAIAGQTLTGLWLRRPTLAGDVAYAPLQRTLTVRGGFQQQAATAMFGTLTANRPASATVLFGPATVTSVAAPAPAAATTVGEDLLHVVFAQPLPVVAGTLYLEFETTDAPLQISTEHWVDSVWQPGGVDQGYVAAVGDGSCTTRAEPTRLRWSAAWGPATGAIAEFEVTGAPPTIGGQLGYVLVWAGLDPQTRGPGPGFLGFGAPLAAIDPTLVGCHQWAPFDVAWGGTTTVDGAFTTTLPLPGTAALGTRLAVQAGWLDPARTGLPLSISNGLVVVTGAAGVGTRCSTLYFPAGATSTPWPPFLGQMPVLRFEF